MQFLRLGLILRCNVAKKALLPLISDHLTISEAILDKTPSPNKLPALYLSSMEKIEITVFVSTLRMLKSPPWQRVTDLNASLPNFPLHKIR